jgi:histidyl-tRNA synthetase
MKDVLPPAVSKWQFVEEKARAVLESFAFRELRSAGPLAQAYLAHRRWESEPVTRWYRLGRSDPARLEAAVFGARPATADAELVAMTAGMLAEIGVPGGRRRLKVAASDEVRGLLTALALPHDASGALDLSFEARDGGERLAFGLRNDDLVSSLGGPAVPALLLQVDLEPVVDALDEPDENFEPPLTAYFACDGVAARAWAVKAAHKLRLDGVRAEIGHDGAGVDEQQARAAALGARLAVVVREEDLHAGQVLVEDHGTDRREIVSVDDLESTIRQRVD